MQRARLTRRAALAGAVFASAAPALAANPWGGRPELFPVNREKLRISLLERVPVGEPGATSPGRALVAIEQQLGGRLGVLAVDTGSGRRIGHRETERFPMCSAFKWLLAAAVLARVDAGQERPDRVIRYDASQLFTSSPVTRANAAKGGLSVRELCAAAVEASDSTAANLLLASLGGPAGLTQWLRSIGDPATRLDRTELALNSSIPGDPRDTTTPEAMVGDMRKLLLGSVLSPGSRQLLLDWLVGCQTGLKRLRAGLPRDWRVGDKTGTWDGRWSSCNDLAIAWPPGRAPILMFAFSTAGPAGTQAREAALAEVGRFVADWASA